MAFCLSVTLITQLLQPNLKSLMAAPSNLFPMKKTIKETGKEADVAVALHCFRLASAPSGEHATIQKVKQQKRIKWHFGGN